MLFWRGPTQDKVQPANFLRKKIDEERMTEG